jgi:heme-degrading monooxygenase HmoA
VVARVTRFEGRTPDAAGQQARAFGDLLPTLEGIDGFRGLILLGDPGQGVGLAVSLWTNEEAARASEDAAHFLREATTEAGESVASVEQYEVTLFHV